jgi:hypothetical protein
MEIYNITIDTCCCKIQDSLVMVAMGYGLDHRDFNSSSDNRLFFTTVISSGILTFQRIIFLQMLANFQ